MTRTPNHLESILSLVERFEIGPFVHVTRSHDDVWIVEWETDIGPAMLSHSEGPFDLDTAIIRANEIEEREWEPAAKGATT